MWWSGMSEWSALERELDAWLSDDSRGGNDVGGSRRRATLWWRDDDAAAVTPQLDQLLALATRSRISVGLAVIPSRATSALVAMLRDHSETAILQHGWSHMSHAPAPDKKAELGAHRAVDVVLADIGCGMERLCEIGAACLPVLVPPWNRIADDVVARLGELGITGLSTFRPRGTPVPGLQIVNTHADIIDWRGSRGFAGTEVVLGQIVAHLRDRRLGLVDPLEPTGVLTHHLVHDDESWQFLNDLFSLSAEHPAALWLAANEVFATPASG